MRCRSNRRTDDSAGNVAPVDFQQLGKGPGRELGAAKHNCPSPLCQVVIRVADRHRHTAVAQQHG